MQTVLSEYGTAYCQNQVQTEHITCCTKP